MIRAATWFTEQTVRVLDQLPGRPSRASINVSLRD